VEERRGHAKRKRAGIEVRNERGKEREVAIKAKIENVMKGPAIGNEIGSARELANKNEKGNLRGINMIVLRSGRETEKGRRKRNGTENGKERRNVSAKGRRRKLGKEKKSENAERKKNAKGRKHESAKERWKRSANATVKKSAKDIAKGNGGAIDTMIGSAESERRNATRKETVQGSAN
jgi:hypothetical protein